MLKNYWGLYFCCVMSAAISLLAGCLEGNRYLNSTAGLELDTSELSFPISVVAGQEKGNNFYRNPICGIRIESVRADGQWIASHPLSVKWQDFDLGTFWGPCQSHLYQMRLELDKDDKYFELITLEWMKADDYKILAYSIPRNIKRLLIKYRPRYYLDELGPEMSVRICYRDSWN